jgi:hypothetical protein
VATSCVPRFGFACTSRLVEDEEGLFRRANVAPEEGGKAEFYHEPTRAAKTKAAKLYVYILYTLVQAK